MANFHQFLNFFAKCINIGPAYIRGWVGRVQGWVGRVVVKIKTKRKETEMVEFRVAMTSTCTHKRLMDVMATPRPTQMFTNSGSIISSPCQIGAFHWHHFTSCQCKFTLMVRKK